MSAVGRVGPVGVGASQGAAPAHKENTEFRAVLEAASQKHGLKFSRHAIERLETRQVSLGASEFDRLGSAVERADGKGAQESLVLLDQLAFVVSVRNRTVITAMEPSKEGVFTSIDSAVIA